MRDLLLVGVFVAILPMALKHTWIAVNLWTWISVMNPHRLAWGFAYSMPFAMIAAIAAFASIPGNRNKLRFPTDAAVVFLLLFIAWTCVTTVFSFYPAASADQLNKVIKIQVMTLVALAAIRERKHIEWFVWVNALSIAFYGVKGGIFTIISGGGSRVWGPSGGFIEGNNEIGLAMVMVIPLLNYLRMVSPNRWIRWCLLLAMLLTAAAVLGTHSRGALLAIAAMSVVLWMRSPKKAWGLMVLGAVGFSLLAFMPENWVERMQSIQSYQEDSSAMGRINAWVMAFNLANDRFLGGGYEVITPELFRRYAPDPIDLHAAHSIYFQVLGEHGWVGLLLFLGIGFCSFRDAGRVRKLTREREETQWLYHLCGSLQVSMAGFAVGGAFLSLAYFDLPYNILVMVVACSWWVREERWKLEARGALGSGVPVVRLKPRRLLGAA
jgi:putative inorganic carbon (HCO3(-)) transporter